MEHDVFISHAHQRSVLEASLRKAQEEKSQLAQQDADLAGFHNGASNTQYQKEREDVQPANEDAESNQML